MKNTRFNDFYEAYNFLKEHEMTKTYIDIGPHKHRVDHFYKCLDIDVTKVNPKTCEIDTNSELNTKTEVWLELGRWSEESNTAYHDYDLDCGGDTFEEAVIKLANLVDEYYDEKTGEKIKSDCGLL